MQDQTHHGTEEAALPSESGPRPPACIPTSLSREEIQDLKREREGLKQRVQLALGAEIDNVAQTGFVGRIQDLEHRNQALVTELVEARASYGEGEVRVTHTPGAEGLDGLVAAPNCWIVHGAPPAVAGG
ncbi:hypothetical protein [Streptomyces sp. NPDC006510]|uniref:hypothetical protein n=1 Tax=Streptomyces sp. NPDC006510 TaxID=3155600 RepID=UPI0033AC7D91